MFLNDSKSEASSKPVRLYSEQEDYDESIEVDEYEGYEEFDDSIVEDVLDNYESTVTVGSKSSSSFELPKNINTGAVIGIVAGAFIIALLVFIFLVQKKKAPRGRFMRWLREFLNFRSIMIAGIIKFAYLFAALVLTGFGFLIMFSGDKDSALTAVLVGLAVIIFGNIFLRITLEMTMIMIGLWENTSDMRAVLVKDEEKPKEKPEDKPEEKIEKVLEEAPPKEIAVQQVNEPQEVSEEPQEDSVQSPTETI